MRDQSEYRRYMGKAELDKSINSLLGLVEGIAIDARINDTEAGVIQAWLAAQRIRAHQHPFNEILPVLERAIVQGVLGSEEKDDLLWLCRSLTSTEYFGKATADMQRLHLLVAGIASDGQVSVEELRGLSGWLQENEHLKTCWPYDELESLVCEVLSDGRIDPNEHAVLMAFFNEFVSTIGGKAIANPVVLEGTRIVGLCAVCPDIQFSDSVFCLTGSSQKYSRQELESLISTLGGKVAGSVSRKVRYLIVGSESNPCWAYACYGRKVERAVELRKEGHPIVIVHESDFHDAVADRVPSPG